jgi:pSer/pThr/pTyr-binding forkhead associated (FHA) protein
MSYEVSGPALVIQHTGQVFPLEADTVTLGNHEDNLMVLADPRVSPYHAAISWRADMGAYVIEDLGSGAGTYVNEVPIAGPQLLRHGDVIRIGNTIIRGQGHTRRHYPVPGRRRSNRYRQ